MACAYIGGSSEWRYDGQSQTIFLCKRPQTSWCSLGVDIRLFISQEHTTWLVIHLCRMILSLKVRHLATGPHEKLLVSISWLRVARQFALAILTIFSIFPMPVKTCVHMVITTLSLSLHVSCSRYEYRWHTGSSIVLWEIHTMYVQC